MWWYDTAKNAAATSASARVVTFAASRYSAGTDATPNSTAGNRRLHGASPNTTRQSRASTEYNGCCVSPVKTVRISASGCRSVPIRKKISSHHRPLFSPISRSTSAKAVIAPKNYPRNRLHQTVCTCRRKLVFRGRLPCPEL